jgi:predicted short-subunit dehydrogenase-like oxidoreductase (DUF2520 family)
MAETSRCGAWTGKRETLAAYPVGIIGDGRVATALQEQLRALAVPHLQWSRRAEAQHQGTSLRELLESCAAVAVCLSDGAVADWIEANRGCRPEQDFFHVSGFLVVPGAYAFHPLAAFTATRERGTDEFARIPFICDDVEAFRRLLPFLANPAYALPDEQRALYHAWVNLAGNGAAFLAREAARGLERIGLPPRELLGPFLEGVVRNIEADVEAAPSGPWARGDRAAIERHFAALSGQDPTIQAFFRALSARFTQEDT